MTNTQNSDAMTEWAERHAKEEKTWAERRAEKVAEVNAKRKAGRDKTYAECLSLVTEEEIVKHFLSRAEISVLGRARRGDFIRHYMPTAQKLEEKGLLERVVRVVEAGVFSAPTGRQSRTIHNVYDTIRKSPHVCYSMSAPINLLRMIYRAFTEAADLPGEYGNFDTPANTLATCRALTTYSGMNVFAHDPDACKEIFDVRPAELTYGVVDLLYSVCNAANALNDHHVTAPQNAKGVKAAMFSLEHFCRGNGILFSDVTA